MAEDQHKCANAFTAVIKKHINCIQDMSTDVLVAKDEFGQTPLHHAAKESNHDIARVLIDKAPELKNIASNNDELPSHLAAAKGDMRMLEMLLAAPLRDSIHTALHRIPVVYRITANVEVHSNFCIVSEDLNGTSVLMSSIVRGDNNMALFLLKKFGKALAILPNNSRMLPLHVAAAQGNIEFIRIATKYDGVMTTARDEFGCSPCVYGVQGGHLTTVKYLVEKAHAEIGSVSNRGQSLLHIACLCGQDQMVHWLLERMGSEAVLWNTHDNANAIHCAAFAGSVSVLHQLLSQFSRKKRKQILSLRDCRGNSPLHLAAINNHLDAALYLLGKGADSTLVNGAGHSAQGIANLRGHKQMADMLVTYNGTKKRKGGKQQERRAATLDTRAVGTTPRAIVRPAHASEPVSRASDVIGRTLSPRELSSGYSSNGEFAELNAEFPIGDVVRRRMRFVEDRNGSVSRVSSDESAGSVGEVVFETHEDNGLSDGSRSLPRSPTSRKSTPIISIGKKAVRESAAQTDADSLQSDVQLISDDRWRQQGLVAVEQIDRVLEEIDINTNI